MFNSIYNLKIVDRRKLLIEGLIEVESYMWALKQISIKSSSEKSMYILQYLICFFHYIKV